MSLEKYWHTVKGKISWLLKNTGMIVTEPFKAGFFLSASIVCMLQNQKILPFVMVNDITDICTLYSTLMAHCLYHDLLNALPWCCRALSLAWVLNLRSLQRAPYFLKLHMMGMSCDFTTCHHGNSAFKVRLGWFRSVHTQDWAMAWPKGGSPV